MAMISSKLACRLRMCKWLSSKHQIKEHNGTHYKHLQHPTTQSLKFDILLNVKNRQSPKTTKSRCFPFPLHTSLPYNLSPFPRKNSLPTLATTRWLYGSQVWPIFEKTMAATATRKSLSNAPSSSQGGSGLGLGIGSCPKKWWGGEALTRLGPREVESGEFLRRGQVK